jgi:hypothetical protein
LRGLIELEAIYESTDFKNGERETRSDLSLSSIEIGIDANITDCLKASVQVESEDETSFSVDNAVFHIQAKDVCEPNPLCDSFWYANIGKMDLPFGYFESHLYTDPITLKLGETKGTAVSIGIHRSFFNVFGGVYNGHIDKTGNKDHIESYFSGVYLSNPNGKDSDFFLKGGVSYISNIADSDEMQEFLLDEFEKETIEDYVGGINGFISISLFDKYFLEAEYVSAVKEFKEDPDFEPKAWNVEFAFHPTDNSQIALGYSGSAETLDSLPETHITGGGGYTFFNHVQIGIECFYDRFKSKDEVYGALSQLSVTF